MVLLHFVASWAERICGPHADEVHAAAARLGATVVTCDVAERPDPAREYGVLNVPAVAVEGAPEMLVVGAHPGAVLVEKLGFARGG